VRIYRVDLDAGTGDPSGPKPQTVYDAGPLEPGVKLWSPIRLKINSADLFTWKPCSESDPWLTKKTALPPKRLDLAVDRFMSHQNMPAILDMHQMLSIGSMKPELRYPQFDWSEHIPDIERPGKRWATEADFVVIGRSVHDPGHYLRTLIVSWSQGKASRIGCAWISESDWVKLKNREWKKVVLA
jgi:hypothetical protein